MFSSSPGQASTVGDLTAFDRSMREKREAGTQANQFRSPGVVETSAQNQAALFGAADWPGAGPELGAGPVLISIVLVVFVALAGFLIVRCSTPLSK